MRVNISLNKFEFSDFPKNKSVIEHNRRFDENEEYRIGIYLSGPKQKIIRITYFSEKNEWE